MAVKGPGDAKPSAHCFPRQQFPSRFSGRGSRPRPQTLSSAKVRAHTGSGCRVREGARGHLPGRLDVGGGPSCSVVAWWCFIEVDLSSISLTVDVVATRPPAGGWRVVGFDFTRVKEENQPWELQDAACGPRAITVYSTHIHCLLNAGTVCGVGDTIASKRSQPCPGSSGPSVGARHEQEVTPCQEGRVREGSRAARGREGSEGLFWLEWISHPRSWKAALLTVRDLVTHSETSAPSWTAWTGRPRKPSQPTLPLSVWGK